MGLRSPIKRFYKKHLQYRINVLRNQLFPYQFNPNRFADTFLAHTEHGNDDLSREIPKVVWVFWTGHNEMSENRKRSMQVLASKIGLPIKLVTPDNLSEYILPEAPLHPAYQYLSLVHKSDYLRCYFMHFHGGAYTDVKECQYDWQPIWQELADSSAYMIGYPEIRPEDIVQHESQKINQDTKRCFSQMVGNGAYICRPNTALTRDWYAELQKRMDKYADLLAQNPGNVLGDNDGYPIAWAGILGSIFHPLYLKYNHRILRNPQLRPITENYR